MSESRQSLAERMALNDTWQADPKVVAFRAALRAHAVEHDLDFDKPGMDALAAFAQQWWRDNGALPDSGIMTG